MTGTTNLLQRPQDAAQDAAQQPPGTDAQGDLDDDLEGQDDAAEVDAEDAADQGDDGAQEAEGDADQGAEDADQDDRPHNREQRYRLKLRQAEAERDAALKLVGNLQRHAVARLAGQRLADGADLLAVGGAQLADLLDGDGLPDAALVDRACTELLRTRGGLAKPTWPGMGQGDRGSSGNGQSWTEAFRPR